MISKKFSEFRSVAGIFVDAELEVLAELFVEFLEVFSILRDFLEELKAFLGDVLLDNLKNLVVLEILSGDVKRKILGVNNTSDEAKIFGDQLIAVIHNEDSSNVQLNVVFLLLGLEHIKGSSLGDEDDRLELKTAFS